MNKPIRQGDVYLEPVASVPDGAKPRKSNVKGRHVIAYGEVTGHHHSVAVKDAELLESAEDVYLRIMRTTDLVHQEHGAITLEPGIYRYRPQREYKPNALPTRVLD